MQKKTIILLFVEAIIFLTIIFGGYYYMSRKIDTAEQNIRAYKGEIESLELKNGELLTVRDSYILKKNELEEELGITKSEIKELKKKLNSTLTYISKIEAEIRVDTIETVRDSIVYVDSNPSIHFSYQDKWLSFNGQTNILNNIPNTSIYNLLVSTSAKVGLTEDYQFFIQTDNPYVKFTSIEGSVIDGTKLYPKKQKWSWGLQGGMGMVYGMTQKQFDLGLYLGIGVEKKF